MEPTTLIDCVELTPGRMRASCIGIRQAFDELLAKIWLAECWARQRGKAIKSTRVRYRSYPNARNHYGETGLECWELSVEVA